MQTLKNTDCVLLYADNYGVRDSSRVGVEDSRKEEEERVGEYSECPTWAKTSKERHALNAPIFFTLFKKAD
jgi:hypothetical protein